MTLFYLIGIIFIQHAISFAEEHPYITDNGYYNILQERINDEINNPDFGEIELIEEDPRRFYYNREWDKWSACEQSLILEKILNIILDGPLRQIDFINDLVVQVKKYNEIPKNLQDPQLAWKFKKLLGHFYPFPTANSLRANNAEQPSNTTPPDKGRTQILFKTKLPQIDKPQCKKALLGLVNEANQKYREIASYDSCAVSGSNENDYSGEIKHKTPKNKNNNKPDCPDSYVFRQLMFQLLPYVVKTPIALNIYKQILLTNENDYNNQQPHYILFNNGRNPQWNTFQQNGNQLNNWYLQRYSLPYQNYLTNYRAWNSNILTKSNVQENQQKPRKKNLNNDIKSNESDENEKANNWSEKKKYDYQPNQFDIISVGPETNPDGSVPPDYTRTQQPQDKDDYYPKPSNHQSGDNRPKSFINHNYVHSSKQNFDSKLVPNDKWDSKSEKHYSQVLSDSQPSVIWVNVSKNVNPDQSHKLHRNEENDITKVLPLDYGSSHHNKQKSTLIKYDGFTHRIPLLENIENFVTSDSEDSSTTAPYDLTTNEVEYTTAKVFEITHNIFYDSETFPKESVENTSDKEGLIPDFIPHNHLPNYVPEKYSLIENNSFPAKSDSSNDSDSGSPNPANTDIENILALLNKKYNATLNSEELNPTPVHLHHKLNISYSGGGDAKTSDNGTPSGNYLTLFGINGSPNFQKTSNDTHNSSNEKSYENELHSLPENNDHATEYIKKPLQIVKETNFGRDSDSADTSDDQTTESSDSENGTPFVKHSVNLIKNFNNGSHLQPIVKLNGSTWLSEFNKYGPKYVEHIVNHHLPNDFANNTSSSDSDHTDDANSNISSNYIKHLLKLHDNGTAQENDDNETSGSSESENFGHKHVKHPVNILSWSDNDNHVSESPENNNHGSQYINHLVTVKESYYLDSSDSQVTDDDDISIPMYHTHVTDEHSESSGSLESDNQVPQHIKHSHTVSNYSLPASVTSQDYSLLDVKDLIGNLYNIDGGNLTSSKANGNFASDLLKIPLYLNKTYIHQNNNFDNAARSESKSDETSRPLSVINPFKIKGSYNLTNYVGSNAANEPKHTTHITDLKKDIYGDLNQNNNNNSFTGLLETDYQDQSYNNLLGHKENVTLLSPSGLIQYQNGTFATHDSKGRPVRVKIIFDYDSSEENEGTGNDQNNAKNSAVIKEIIIKDKNLLNPKNKHVNLENINNNLTKNVLDLYKIITKGKKPGVINVEYNVPFKLPEISRQSHNHLDNSYDSQEQLKNFEVNSPNSLRERTSNEDKQKISDDYINNYDDLVSRGINWKVGDKFVDEFSLLLEKLKNSSGVPQLSYVVKVAPPILRPYYYVTYTIPVQLFIERTRGLLEHKPSLGFDVEQLLEEIIAVSNITSITSDLKSSPTSNFIDLSLLDGKLSVINETLFDRFKDILLLNSTLDHETRIKQVDLGLKNLQKEFSDNDKVNLKKTVNLRDLPPDNKGLVDIVSSKFTNGISSNDFKSTTEVNGDLGDDRIENLAVIGLH